MLDMAASMAGAKNVVAAKIHSQESRAVYMLWFSFTLGSNFIFLCF